MASTSRPHQRIIAMLAACAALAAGAAYAEDDQPHALPERLRGLPLSGKALESVAERIDPSKPLGWCDPADKAPRIRVILPNVRNSKGNIRLSLHGPDPDQWVGKKGGKLIRFDVPASQGRMEACMPLPNGRGIYAVGLYHDENANGKYGFASEGYGFSNNAKAGMFGPASHKDAVFTTGDGTTDLTIDIRY
ncbi:DUF2141 domain-containing protein [Emcibacter sp. SYSU 3D8]|uniref:DUF2141 domain-containing protein n=1 Tax=Emcibacter sp. SYSU 3D8 TaxID=3133969 RepID=UPI0031FE5548